MDSELADFEVADLWDDSEAEAEADSEAADSEAAFSAADSEVADSEELFSRCFRYAFKSVRCNNRSRPSSRSSSPPVSTR